MKNLSGAFNAICLALIAFILLIIIWGSCTGCSVIHKHKEQTSHQLDSTHQVQKTSLAGSTLDSLVKTIQLDTSKKQTWWNYERVIHTTTRMDTIEKSPGIRTVVPIQETTIQEKGLVHSQENVAKSSEQKTDLHKADTTSKTKTVSSQVKKNDQATIMDKKVTDWFKPVCFGIAAVLILVFVLYEWPVILPFIRRLKPRS